MNPLVWENSRTSLRHQRFPLRIRLSIKQWLQKFHSDDVSLPRGSLTNQKHYPDLPWVVTRRQYEIFALIPQTSFREQTSGQWCPKMSAVFSGREPTEFFFSYIIMTAEGTLIAHVRCIKALTCLRGFRVKIAIFIRLQCLPIPRRALSTKKIKPIIANWPEILGVVLEL